MIYVIHWFSMIYVIHYDFLWFYMIHYDFMWFYVIYKIFYEFSMWCSLILYDSPNGLPAIHPPNADQNLCGFLWFLGAKSPPGLMKWLKPQWGYHWGSNDPEMLHDSWFTTILQRQVCTKSAGELCAWYCHGLWVALYRGIPTDVTTGVPQVTCSPFLIFLLVRVFLEAAELISLIGTVRFTSRCGVICFTPSYLLNRCCISPVNSPFLIKSSLHIEGHLWIMWISQDY